MLSDTKALMIVSGLILLVGLVLIAILLFV